MALDLKLKISTSEKCDALVVSDITGGFNSENNSGGWGVANILGNQSPDNTKYRLHLEIIPNIILNDNLVRPLLIYSSDGIGTTQGRWSFPSDSLDRFKFILSSEHLYQDIINNSSVTSGDIGDEFVVDGIYNITIRLFPLSESPIAFSDAEYEKSFCFTNVCILKKEVSKMFSAIDVECEDCDDRDIEKALLAKNLLESLEESCNN